VTSCKMESGVKSKGRGAPDSKGTVKKEQGLEKRGVGFKGLADWGGGERENKGRSNKEF